MGFRVKREKQSKREDRIFLGSNVMLLFHHMRNKKSLHSAFDLFHVVNI